jgi:hypothetical protein
VTTYSERYERYFKPLHRKLSRIFPEVSITVAVNGHGTPAAQAAYLHRLEQEIRQERHLTSSSCSTAGPRASPPTGTVR